MNIDSAESFRRRFDPADGSRFPRGQQYFSTGPTKANLAVP